MGLLIRRCDGKVLMAVVLMRTASWMRVAVPDCEDAVELRARGPFWFDESGLPVELSFGGNAASGFFWPHTAPYATPVRTWPARTTYAGPMSVC